MKFVIEISSRHLLASPESRGLKTGKCGEKPQLICEVLLPVGPVVPPGMLRVLVKDALAQQSLMKGAVFRNQDVLTAAVKPERPEDFTLLD